MIFVYGRVKNIVGKRKKMLVTSLFSFSHNVFKRLPFKTHKNQGLFGKGLRGAVRVVRYPLSAISLNISQTAGQIWTKLGRNVLWEVFFKNLCTEFDEYQKLVARATKWIFFFFNAILQKSSPLKLLVRL